MSEEMPPVNFQFEALIASNKEFAKAARWESKMYAKWGDDLPGRSYLRYKKYAAIVEDTLDELGLDSMAFYS